MKAKKVILHTSTFFGMFLVSAITIAFGQEAHAGSALAQNAEVIKWLALGSGLAIGIAAAGCGLGQGKAVASAMEGIGRNPQSVGSMLVPMLLGLAFMEALGILALIFAFVFKAAVLG